MSIETPEELECLRAAGRVVADAIRAMRQRVRPGVTTAELDEVGARVLRRAGARSGPQLDYGFPGANCISVNDEAVHGIPGRRRLRRGDLVKLDVTWSSRLSRSSRTAPARFVKAPTGGR
jgi:methionyl aminopeptidase